MKFGEFLKKIDSVDISLSGVFPYLDDIQTEILSNFDGRSGKESRIVTMKKL